MPIDLRSDINIIFDRVELLGKTIQEFGEFSKVFVLVDESTNDKCFPLLLQNQDYFKYAEIIETPIGEQAKSLDIAYQIWGTLLENGADRNSLLINLGGGVITDLGGFIASTFKRGITFINVPTTLMGQVDAAIGGKTGINFEGIKNQIGTFNNPLFTFVDNSFLATLPKRELLSGLAEIIKYGLIEDSSIIDLVERDWNKHLPELIKKCISIKKRIVENDFKELGERKKLNFGHTIGHAFEVFYDGQLTHGEAVAFGMVKEAELSFKQSLLREKEYLKIKKIINTNFGKLEFKNEEIERLLTFMKYDKKNLGDGINFTLLESIGNAKINYTLSEKEIRLVF